MEMPGTVQEREMCTATPPMVPHTSLISLPPAVVATILSKLDIVSLCSAAAVCKALRTCASHTLSFLSAFSLLEIAPTLDMLRPLLPPNPHLHCLKLDCGNIVDSEVEFLLRPSLEEIYFLNCQFLSGKLLALLGQVCPDIRYISLTSFAEEKAWPPSSYSDLELLLKGCSQLESLCLDFNFTVFDNPNFGEVWKSTCASLSVLKVGYIPADMAVQMISLQEDLPHFSYNEKLIPFANLQKLYLSVDCISDLLVTSISETLISLTHLDLQDAPVEEPVPTYDLTNSGIQQINKYRRLKHVSLVRSQEFLCTCFRRVNDLGILFMADNCSTLESICLGGFCRVTDAGFKALLHSCSKLQTLKVSNGSRLTDLVFHDISETSLSLAHVMLKRCNLLTSLAVSRLASNPNLISLDLRDCRNLEDDALKAISTIPSLQILLLDGTDISDLGMSYLGSGLNSLVSLSVRGCRKLTNNGIANIFAGCLEKVLQVLDLSDLPNLSDDAILLLAKTGVSLRELRVRSCPLVGDTSIMALASMQIDGAWRGSSLHLLDLFECRGITQLAFRWFKKPYFPKLRWLGVTWGRNRDMVDALAISRPNLHVSYRGEELGTCYWDTANCWYILDDEEVDELEQWLLDGEVENEVANMGEE